MPLLFNKFFTRHWQKLLPLPKMVESYPITVAPDRLDCARRLMPYNSSNSWHSRYKHLKMESEMLVNICFPAYDLKSCLLYPYRLHLSTLKVTICGVESKIPVNCELVASIWYKLACAYNEDSNQSAHPHNLIRVLVFSPVETLDHWLPVERPSKTLIRLRRCAV